MQIMSMAKSNTIQGQNLLPPDVSQLIEQLDRHCHAPDGSCVSKSAYYDLQLAREMLRERLRFLESMAIYCEAIAIVEENQQAVSIANLGGIRDRDLHGLYPQVGLKSSPQVLEQIFVVLIKLIKDLKLQHQHHYDDLRKTWLCKRCETMNAKLRSDLSEVRYQMFQLDWPVCLDKN